MALSAKGAVASLLLILGLIATPNGMKATSFSFSGGFSQDDNVQLYLFGVSAPSTVMLQTWSFGGGTDAAGQKIAAGGFATALSLYSASGAEALVGYTTSWSCPPANVDAASVLGCGDAALNESLGAGYYVLAVTEYYNLPNGLTLSAGFSEAGQGNFTGPNLCGATGGFFDADCDQRRGNFEVDIVGANSASAVPEPATFWMAGFALLGVALLVKEMKCHTR
ncbi:MAG TPA: DVUA0089 family protein [Bryobacteraceae bacterium]|jgi:hypothetical protein|nr:DVUA0089 family protein [Bryobacteraceae bacterium]